MMTRSITYKVKKRLKERCELAEAYLRARIESRNESNNNANNNDYNNNNNTDLDRLERVALLLNKASLTFKEAVNTNCSKRRELLEEAFKAYAEIVPYLGKIPYLTIVVLKQIKNIEQMLELEIENSVKNGNVNAIDIDSMMKETREAFL